MLKDHINKPVYISGDGGSYRGVLVRYQVNDYFRPPVFEFYFSDGYILRVNLLRPLEIRGL